MTESMSSSTRSPQMRSYGYAPTSGSTSTPRYRSEPPSRSGSMISVSTATTPSSPGLKSPMEADGTEQLPGYAYVQSAADGPPRHPCARRRDGPGAHRGNAPRARSDRRRLRVARPPRRRRRHGGGGHTTTSRDAGVDQGQPGRAEGSYHDSDRDRLPL